MGAECLLAALGNEGTAEDGDTEASRRYAGALMLVEGLEDLKALRELAVAIAKAGPT